MSQIAIRRINHTQTRRTVNANVSLKVKASLNVGGGPYCLAADSWNGCTAGPIDAEWTLATGTNQLAIPGHHYNPATFAETKCNILMH